MRTSRHYGAGARRGLLPHLCLLLALCSSAQIVPTAAATRLTEALDEGVMEGERNGAAAAIAHYEKQIVLFDAPDDKARLWLAIANSRGKQTPPRMDEAKAAIRAALALPGISGDVSVDALRALAKLGTRYEARRLWADAAARPDLAAGPRVEALLALAEANMQCDCYPQARAALEAAAKIPDTNAVRQAKVWSTLSEIHIFFRDRPAADNACDRILALSGARTRDAGLAWLRKGTLKAKPLRYAEIVTPEAVTAAEACYAHAVSISGVPAADKYEAIRAACLSRMDNGQYTEAVTMLEDLIKQPWLASDSVPEIHMLAGDCHGKMGNTREALRRYEAGLKAGSTMAGCTLTKTLHYRVLDCARTLRDGDRELKALADILPLCDKRNQDFTGEWERIAKQLNAVGRKSATRAFAESAGGLPTFRSEAKTDQLDRELDLLVP